jgi:hypothetical protein
MNRRSNVSCLTDQEIEEFLFNRLSGVTREVIEEHLLACQKCLDRVESEEDYVNQMKSAAGEIERETLERAYAGTPERAGWPERLRGWFNAGRRRTWSLALASLLVAGAVSVSQFKSGVPTTESVLLEVHRGEAGFVQARAGAPLSLTLRVDDLADGLYRLELATTDGALLAIGQGTASHGALGWSLNNGFKAGTYWVRVRPAQGGALLREFGLRLR